MSYFEPRVLKEQTFFGAFLANKITDILISTLHQSITDVRQILCKVPKNILLVSILAHYVVCIINGNFREYVNALVFTIPSFVILN